MYSLSRHCKHEFMSQSLVSSLLLYSMMSSFRTLWSFRIKQTLISNDISQMTRPLLDRSYKTVAWKDVHQDRRRSARRENVVKPATLTPPGGRSAPHRVHSFLLVNSRTCSFRGDFMTSQRVRGADATSRPRASARHRQDGDGWGLGGERSASARRRGRSIASESSLSSLSPRNESTRRGTL